MKDYECNAYLNFFCTIQMLEESLYPRNDFESLSDFLDEVSKAIEDTETELEIYELDEKIRLFREEQEHA